MFGAYFGFFFMTFYKIPFWAAFIFSTLCTGLLAFIIEQIAYKPLRQRNAPFLYFIISAMGVSIFLENIVIATIGPTFRTYPSVFPSQPFMLGTIAVGRIDCIMFIISAACLGLLVYFLDYTKMGKAIQAVSYNIKASSLMGINIEFIMITVFVTGGVLAGVAGVLFGMKYTVYPQIGMITLKSFIAAVFGGLGSIPGALIGSVLLGIMETITSGYISSQYRDLIAFILLLLILIIRPMGLMGKTAQDKA